MSLAPENTFASFDLALEMGVDAIECDVRPCRDHFVLLHDETLDRTTSYPGKVRDYRFSELLKMGSSHENKIPLLEEFLERYLGKAELNLELKGDFSSQELASFLSQLPSEGKGIILSSFNTLLLEEIRRFGSSLPIGVLYHENASAALKVAQRVEAKSLHPHLNLLESHPYFDRSRFEIYPYTVDQVSDHLHCIHHEVDGAFYNDPRLALHS